VSLSKAAQLPVLMLSCLPATILTICSVGFADARNDCKDQDQDFWLLIFQELIPFSKPGTSKHKVRWLHRLREREGDETSPKDPYIMYPDSSAQTLHCWNSEPDGDVWRCELSDEVIEHTSGCVSANLGVIATPISQSSMMTRGQHDTVSDTVSELKDVLMSKAGTNDINMTDAGSSDAAIATRAANPFSDEFLLYCTHYRQFIENSTLSPNEQCRLLTVSGSERVTDLQSDSKSLTFLNSIRHKTKLPFSSLCESEQLFEYARHDLWESLLSTKYTNQLIMPHKRCFFPGAYSYRGSSHKRFSFTAV
jgi:hypothetical protein